MTAQDRMNPGDEQLWLDEQGTGGDLGDLTVRCECGKKRGLHEAAEFESFEEFGETTNLGVIDDGRIVYVAMSESSRPGLRMASRVGGSSCLHSTAMGKAILAFFPEADREARITNLELTAVTPKTITDPGQMRDELEQARRRGYAIDNEENEIGARCVGVPILDDSGFPLGAISVSGPTARMNDDALDAMAKRLWAASQEISSNLGYRLTTAHGEHPGRADEG